MKEILYFLKWQLKRWKLSDIVWVVSCGLFGSGSYSLITNPSTTPWQFYAGFTGIFLILLKAAVIDGVRNSWDRYQHEKAKLLADLKETNA